MALWYKFFDHYEVHDPDNVPQITQILLDTHILSNYLLLLFPSHHACLSLPDFQKMRHPLIVWDLAPLQFFLDTRFAFYADPSSSFLFFFTTTPSHCWCLHFSKMAGRSTCPTCQSSDIEIDHVRGNQVCRKCGNVLDDSLIISEVSTAGWRGTEKSGWVVADEVVPPLLAFFLF